ncbi:hypothetical protein ABZ946_21530 [Streptomyces sp. NPDC046324]|uniref:hypothetical protein n=1 Tax=Streptomyces sp. NPDC046324 TaxID=3154915 RepID=UPI0033F899B2
MPGSVIPTGPIFGPDSLVITVDSGTEAASRIGVRIWPDAVNTDLARSGEPTRFYFQPPRVTIATRPGTTDLEFSATAMVQSPVGPHPQYLGGSCTFSCTVALPADVQARIVEKLANHDHPDPPTRIAHLFTHRRGDPDPELLMVPITGSAVSCVIKQPRNGSGPLLMSVQGGPGGGIDAQASSSFLVSFSPAAAEAVVTNLREASAPPFVVRNVLTEQFDTGPTALTATLDIDVEQLHEVFRAAVPPGEPWPDGDAADTAYRSAVTAGAVRTGLTESGGGPLDPSLATWLGSTDDLRTAVFVMVRERLFEVADAEVHPTGGTRSEAAAPGWWSAVFGDARMTLKREPAAGSVRLRDAVTLHGAVSAERTVEGDLAEVAAAARHHLDTYLNVIAL